MQERPRQLATTSLTVLNHTIGPPGESYQHRIVTIQLEL